MNTVGSQNYSDSALMRHYDALYIRQLGIKKEHLQLSSDPTKHNSSSQRQNEQQTS